MDITLIQNPLWWVLAFLWGTLFLFTAAPQVLRRWYLHLTSPGLRRQKIRLVENAKQEKSLHEDDTRDVLKDCILARGPQIAAAFERPFRYMGVHTEEHRQEIEAAIHALYRFDSDPEALSICLNRLLQAAKQNWLELAVFSPREQEVLELLLENCTYKEMSSRLYVSASTIKTHVYHIFQKLDVSTRDEAIHLIYKRGWFQIQPQDALDEKIAVR